MKNCKIILKNENEEKEVLLDEKFQFNEKENFITYHFKSYTCDVEVYDINIEKIILNISGINYEMDCKIEENRKYIFRFPMRSYFQCVWGYTILSLKVYTSTRSYYLYSKLINVALDSTIQESLNIENSIKNMIKFILDNNIDFYLSNPEQKLSINHTNFLGNNFKTMYNELSQIKEVIKSYSKNKSYFLNDLKYNLSLDYKIESFEKVRTIDNNILKFIIQNPQYLQKVNSKKGILYQKEYYSPTKTLVDSKKFNYDIEENKVILGFLKYIYIYIEQRLFLIKEILRDNKKDSHYTLQNIINFYYEFYYQQLLEMKPAIENLYFYYKKIMKCDEQNVENVPKYSFIFKNFHHYREVYIVISNWFQNKNYNLDKKNTLNNLTTVDKIYEYYSLGNLIKGILNLGYTNKKIYSYAYSNLTNNISHIKEINTFIFERDLQRLTLYYQPYIYTDKFENEIELYRVEGHKNKVYTPDFIIKIESPNKKNKYIILDSKWQKLNTLKKYTLKEIIYKYCYSIEGSEEVDYLNTIILQGREEMETNYSFHNSKLSLEKKVTRNVKLEIVPLNPKINKLNYILKIIENS